MPEAPGRALTDTLGRALRARRLLLVLDNCEHLLDACAALAEALLRAGPGVRVLATSRRPWGRPGEATWRVPPSWPAGPAGEARAPEALPPPEALLEYGAVRLFWSGRGTCGPPSSSPPPTPRRWCRSAPAWTGCPWPWS